MEKEVLIVGGGIVALCCALSLQSRGFRVRLVERDQPGQGASAGNAGVISPWSFIPQSVPGIARAIPRLLFGPQAPVAIHPAALRGLAPWGLRFLRHSSDGSFQRSVEALARLCGPSIDLFRKHLAGTGGEDLIADSWYLHAYRDPTRARIEALEYRTRVARGAEIERIDQAELLRLEPALSPRFRAAIVIRGQARARSPAAIGRHLAERVRKQGGTILRREVLRIAPEADGWRVATGSDDFLTPRVVIAAGAWSTRLLAPLGLKMPLIAERGYHVEFPDSGVGLGHSVMDMDRKVVASAMSQGIRVAGMAEFGPLEAPPSSRMEGRLLQAARDMLPELDRREGKVWMGHRPSFPDSLPVLGSLGHHPGLYGAFGHSHYGLMTAPASGELLAGLLDGVITQTDLAAYSAGRFAA
ncbi:FAD-dependent oxidoreductase [Paracoccus sp. MBLB3053]|uniref:FAD-dependent oxidoreductase n=1 Tax=Paracoccus aurantius TaxID=3073814 RepID=A0ABU2HW69_9RHOB|nr:FAD-dependent oxidoreductase [Paracoccus sp. MBLB3053]MDS9468765.1 FAD-dependent oxidoreductase [Paracoccus sp. MBLB3053]